MDKKLKVKGIDISLDIIGKEDYISLTDMAKGRESDNYTTDEIIRNWIRRNETLEFLSVWESLHNPNFKPVQMDGFKKEAGTNRLSLTPRQWIGATNAIGIISKPGRYGGTYAHKDIAFEFCSWISPVFKLYLINEYQRLKEIESSQKGVDWNIVRTLSKVNYKVQTDAINEHIIPNSNYVDKSLEYASEADMLNMIVFGVYAYEWRKENEEKAARGENIRDNASDENLAILATLEGINAFLIQSKVVKYQRYNILCDACKQQRASNNGKDLFNSVRKISDTVEYQKKLPKDDFDKGMKSIVGYNLDNKKGAGN